MRSQGKKTDRTFRRAANLGAWMNKRKSRFCFARFERSQKAWKNRFHTAMLVCSWQRKNADSAATNLSHQRGRMPRRLAGMPASKSCQPSAPGPAKFSRPIARRPWTAPSTTCCRLHRGGNCQLVRSSLSWPSRSGWRNLQHGKPGGSASDHALQYLAARDQPQ